MAAQQRILKKNGLFRAGSPISKPFCQSLHEPLPPAGRKTIDRRILSNLNLRRLRNKFPIQKPLSLGTPGERGWGEGAYAQTTRTIVWPSRPLTPAPLPRSTGGEGSLDSTDAEVNL